MYYRPPPPWAYLQLRQTRISHTILNCFSWFLVSYDLYHMP
jgi:hypothetical protein